MRLFNRLSGDSRKNGDAREDRGIRGRNNDEGRRPANAGRKNLTARKLGMEALEERQLLSVNPVGADEYAEIRAAYAEIQLPDSLSQINVIELTDLTSDALQNAVDLAAQTPQDDLVLLRTTDDSYVLNLENSAITINIDSENYGKLTILGKGTEALTIETVDSNAFTVLNGDVAFDGALIYNYATVDYLNDMIIATGDATVTRGSSLAIVNQIQTTDAETGEISSSYIVDRAATQEELDAAGMSNVTATSAYRTVANPHQDGADDYNSVRNSVHAVMRSQYDYFGYTPATYRAVSASQIYDAECPGYAGWVGTVANMMAYTGWAQRAGFSTRMTLSDGSTVTYDSVEDAVADYLMNNFMHATSSFPYSESQYAYDQDVTAAKILDYLFSGDDEDCMGSNYSHMTNSIEAGGFFMDIDFGRVGGYVPASDSMLNDMLSALNRGHAVTMEIVTTNNQGAAPQREYVSVWGYVYNPSTRNASTLTSNGVPTTTVGLICSNPTRSAYEQQVTDSRYNNTENNPRTLTHYVERNSSSGDVYDTYSTYLLSGSGANLTLVHAPYTYLNDQGAVQGAINFPEGFTFYGANNSQYVTWTSRIVGFSWIQQYASKLSSVEVNQDEILSLESMPGNTENVIFLYFGGLEGTGWDGLEHPALNLDNAAGYGVAELRMIEEVWRRVAEDYAPFNVNVTTSASVWAAASKGIRCVIGGYHSSAGGLSGVGSYGAGKNDNYVYPFSLSLNAKYIADAAAHEVGHSLGLSHDGNEHNEYEGSEYRGNSVWGPIMGAPYDSAMTQWSQGEYVGATNLEDDVAIIASVLGHRADDFGDTPSDAASLDDYYVPVDINAFDPIAGTYNVKGVIEKRTDYDVFSFTSYGGKYVVDVSGDGADSRFINSSFNWTRRNYSTTENALFGGLYYADTYNYTNLNLKVELLDETGEIVLIGMNGKQLFLNPGETVVVRDSDYYFYVLDQFGEKVYVDGKLKEGYQAVDDSIHTTFSHFVTPDLQAGKTYYIRVTGVGEGNPSTNGFSDYGSLGQYTLSMHESYENFYLDEASMDVSDVSYATKVDNVLSWQEAIAYSGRRLEDGARFMGNSLKFNASLAGQTLNLQETLLFSYSRSLVAQPYSAKRFVLDAMNAWNYETDAPGITINANEKFRAIYVDNTTVELYGFTITGGVAETTNVIYLYFNGVDGTGWDGLLHPAFDLDGDATTLSPAEQDAINEIYLRVVEDYAPYDVAVTTDQSVFEAATNAIRVVIGGASPTAGGVAYVGSFGANKQDCYVYPNSLGRSAKSIAEAVSHEVGHTLGLHHDGKNSDEYYGGTNGWAPIMGVGYYHPLTQWSKGEYNGATNTQDDLAVIAGRLAYKDDDYEDSITGAQPLASSYLQAGNLVADGIIERTGDVDMFTFVATDSTYVIDVSGFGANFANVDANGYAANRGYTNLDVRAKLYDASGNLLYECNPSNSLFAHFQIDNLEVGASYYLSVEGTGLGDPATTGYSNYGSLGQYYVTVAPTDLNGFVGEERFETIATKNAVVAAAAAATQEKGVSYGRVGQTNNGGGIYNHFGWLTIGNSIISGNRAYKAGGGVYNQGGEYTDTHQHDGWLYIVNSAIIGNIVTEENAIGGGVYNEDGGVATFVNVTIAGNTAGYSGGGMQNAGRANLYNTIVANNHARYGVDVYTAAGKSTSAYSSVIGNEARNANLLAQQNGTDTANADGRSRIGRSNGTSVSSTVTPVDAQFVGYRDYDASEWSAELWKFWNFHLKGDSPAVDLGTTYTAANLDFSNNAVRASMYRNLGMTRFIVDFEKDLGGQDRFGNTKVDAGAYELLAKPELTAFIPTSQGSDVVNTWENSIVISRAVDDQTGSVAPFLATEQLYLNLAFINQGQAIKEDFETTVYVWKYDPYTKKADMYASSTEENGLALMNIKVEFPTGAAMPGGTTAATITCTNLATGDVQTFEYNGDESYILLENVGIGSIEEIVGAYIEKGLLEDQPDEGYFVFGYKIDSGEAIDEIREDNNFFLTTSYFDVVESPVSVNDSIVVTTDLDVVNPYDGLISLREAVEVYAGSFYYSEIALQDGDVFVANGVTYYVKDGLFYVDTSANYQVYPGEQFTFTLDVEREATWDAENEIYVDANGDEVSVQIGASITRGGVEYVYNGTQWRSEGGDVYELADGETVAWTTEEFVTVTYMTDVYFDPDGKQVDLAEGTVGVFNGQEVVLDANGAWVNTSVVASYTRDDVQALGVFSLEDGTEVAIVNGVFRRVATNDVAIVQDGDVVTLANGQTAVYDAARDRFDVTVVSTYEVANGDVVVVDGVELTFATDSYVDVGGYKYVLEEGTEVELANGYQVVYQNGSFVYKSQTVNATKIAAGTEILFNGESYTYKAGRSIMRRVSREANAVVFSSDSPNLDGATFVLTEGPLTLDKTFTLDCVDPYGNLLDLTITSSSDDPCLFVITDAADATVRNFKFVGATSTEEGSIFENYGELTLEQLSFFDNAMEKGNLIFNADGATLTVVNTSFANNAADSGALIYNLGSTVIKGTVDALEGTTVYTTFFGDSAHLSPVYNQGGSLQIQYAQFYKTSGQNGGAINVAGGSAVVANSQFNGATATENGGAINLEANGKLVVDSVNFEANSAVNGGAINVASGVATINATEFLNNTATENGGAIYNAGTVEARQSQFKGSTAVDGGAIYNDSALNVYGSTFDGNVATERGGAVYSSANGVLYFEADPNNTADPELAVGFYNNVAKNGGALYAETGFYAKGDVVAEGNTASENYGAIYANGAVIIEGRAAFANNVVNGDYGAAYVGDYATVDALELDSNTTLGNGGAFNVVGNLTVNDYAFVSNNERGAIVVGGDVLVKGDATFADNVGLEGAAVLANGKFTVGGNAIANGNQAREGNGGAFKVAAFEVVGEFNGSNNVAFGDGGAIYSDGDVKLGNAVFFENEAKNSGGAIYANGKIAIAYARFVSNAAAVDGGAVYAAGDFDVSNALFAKNAAGGLGGAVYAAANTTFVNVTIADNVAANGAGLYNVGTARIDNSVLANNKSTGTGNDLFTASGATTTLRGSLLADIARVGDVVYSLDGAYRSLLGVDAKLDSEYRLTAASPAVNAGFNALDLGAETDLDGNARRVGLTVDGVVRSVDMGAFEFQTILAPDLTVDPDSVDYWTAKIIVDGEEYQMAYYVYGEDVCINFNVRNIGDAVVLDNFAFNVTLTGVDENGDLVYQATQQAVNYKNEFDRFNWLNREDWIEIGGVQSLESNFGALPAGFYTVSVTLDVEGVGAVYEWGEEDGYEGENNNVYTSSFIVREIPSVVVTTENDVVDASDGLTSLREAVAVAADYEYVHTFLVADGTSFTTENGQTLVVSDGYLTEIVDVVYKDGVPYDLHEGDEFLLNGVKVYYHYQLNGGYFAYANGKTADVSSGSLTYPDGTTASLALQTSQYIHYVNGEEISEQEGARYTYNVIQIGDASYVLEDGLELNYGNVSFVYRQNAEYPNGVFVFEDGSVVDFDPNGSLEFGSLAIGSLSTRNARIERPIVLQDGSTLQIVDGVARMTSSVVSTVTFADNMVGKTIELDPTRGEIAIENTANLGQLASGGDLIVPRTLTIDGEDRNVVVSGDGASRIFNVLEGATATIDSLTLTKGYADVGGAVLNRGALNLNDVNFTENVAVWKNTTTGGDNLEAGLGGAIYNYGALAIDGGLFQSNGSLANGANGATEFGGAIFTVGDAVVKNATFRNNAAYVGGAIAAYDGTLRVENTTFAENAAERAGAIYALVPTTIVASSFESNKAEATSFKTRDVVAGAIYAKSELVFAADPESESNLAVKFVGNVAETAGAVYSEQGFTVDGDLIATDNVAKRNEEYATEVENNYGAIYAGGAVSVTGDATFTGNKASDAYGALFVDGELNVGGALVLSNNAAQNGAYGGATATAVTVGGDATITGNTSTGDYGAIGTPGAFAVGGAATISDNVAGGAYSGVAANSVEIGGALTANDNKAEVASGAVVSETTVTVGGGANVARNVNGAIVAKNDVAIGVNSEIENRDSNFDGNVSESGAGVLAGGAISFGGSVVARNNVATSGEGGFAKADGAVSIDGSLVATNNTATGDGGAIYTMKALTIGEGESNISNNAANGYGGAIYAIDSVEIAGTTVFASNEAGANETALDETVETTTTTGENGETIVTTVKTTTYGAIGGAIYVANGGAAFGGDATFNANKAGSAGAVYANGGVDFQGAATFSGNQATGRVVIETTTEIIPADGSESKTTVETKVEPFGDYGALYAQGDVGVVGDLVATGNSATGNYGAINVDGALSANSITLTDNASGTRVGALYAGVIDVRANLVATGNASGGDVGAIATNGAITVGGDATISNNTAVGEIGAIDAGSSIAIIGSAIVAGNTSGGDVGAIATNGAITVGGNATISGNKAGGAIGAIGALGTVSVGGDATISDNEAEGAIGAISAAGAVAIVGSATVSGNKSGENVGAIGAGGSFTVGGDATITANEATADVGAILTNGAFSVQGAATISDNKAGGNAGAIDAFGKVYVGGDANVLNNAADGDFGAINAQSGVNFVGAATVSGNTSGGQVGAINAGGDVLFGSTATISNNASSGDYGAIFATGAVKSVGDAIVSGNKSGGNVGAIAATSFVVGSDAATANATITGNEAGGDYGALYLTGTGYAFLVYGDAILNENVAGAVPSVESISATSIGENGETISTATTTTTYYGKSGALHVEVGMAKATGNVEFVGNTAASNGAAYVAGNFAVGGDLAMKNNVANGYVETVVAATTTVFDADGNVVSETTENVSSTTEATGDYGAAYIGKNLVVDGAATLEGNKANGDVGALSAVVVKVGGDFVAKANEAGDEIGAVDVQSSLLVGGAATFEGNKAQGDYGAARVAVNATVDGDLNVVENASGASIGGLYVEKTLTVGGNATLARNVAELNVGALYVGGNATVDGLFVATDNSATNGQVGAAFVGGNLQINGVVPAQYDADGNEISVDALAALVSYNKAGAEYGAIAVKGDLTINGDATVSNNVASSDVGAIAVAGNMTVSGVATITENVAGGNVGALDVGGELTLTRATVLRNVASGDAGAIRANSATISDSLLAFNEAGEKGGAILAMNATLVNATVAANKAHLGGGLYVFENATIDLSILAGNEAIAKTIESIVEVDGEETTVSETFDGQGVEIYAPADANVALRNSLIQNVESVGEQTFGEAWLDENYRSFIGVDPLFVDPANGDFSLQAKSVAINTGSNDLAAPDVELDLVGNARFVGLVIDGAVYAVDLGAFEYQTIVAPDLAFSENPVSYWYGKWNEADVEYYFVGADVVLDFSFANLGDAAVVDKFNVSFQIDGVAADGSTFSLTKVARYATGADYFDWLAEGDWIYSDGEVSYARQNLGALPVGAYTVTITLDVDSEIAEWGEEDGSEAIANNVFVANFEVHEAPSVVVNTIEDGEYNPIDDKTTLREAVELYAGPSWYSYKIITDTAEYVADDLTRVNVKDGVASTDYNVAVVDGVDYRLEDGTSVENGALYVVYDAKTGVFTYPDGSQAVYARTNYNYSLTIALADGTELVAKPTPKIEYLESIGEPYSDKDLGVYVDVIVWPNGSETLLSDLAEDSIVYRATHITYREYVALDSDGAAKNLADGDQVEVDGRVGTFRNGGVLFDGGDYLFFEEGDAFARDGVALTYVGAAYVEEDGDGSVKPFVDGETVVLKNGFQFTNAVRQEEVSGEITTVDGRKVVFNDDQTTEISAFVGNTITFAENVYDNVIALDPTLGQITIAKPMTIDASETENKIGVFVSGEDQTRVFGVNQGVVATINSIKLTKGAAVNGGAIYNAGELTLNDVSISYSAAKSDADPDSDKILYEGLGGAVYNSGALVINGGDFVTNTASFFGGAIYSIGDLKLVGATIGGDLPILGNVSGLNGGGVYVLNSNATIYDSVIAKNVAARNAGGLGISIATGQGELVVVNSLIVENIATAANGGGLYAYAADGAKLDVSLTNVTVAGNRATEGLGGGIYADSAKLAIVNSIVALNRASQAVDLALDYDATASVDYSLIGNAEDAINPDAISIGELAFLGSNASPVDPKFGEWYSLTNDSVALNTGSNARAVYADGAAIEFDVNGDARIVGVERNGLVYSVDMGATEFNEVVAPDLAFEKSPEPLRGYFATVDGELTDEFMDGWDVCFDYSFVNVGTAAVVNSFSYAITVAKLDENGEVVEGSEKTFTRKYGENVDGALAEDDWLLVGQGVDGVWNLGAFAAGQYRVTLTVDSNDDVLELLEDNNVFETTFKVAERPSVVVTTELDVVDPYDGLVSLREAIANIGEEGESSISIAKPAQEGDSYKLAANDELGVPEGAVATYRDGKFTFTRVVAVVNEETGETSTSEETVELLAGVAYDLTNGDALTWNGADGVELAAKFVNTITFAENVRGKTISVDFAHYGELTIDRDMTINGDETEITIDANGEGRVFMISHGDVAIRGLAFANGAAEKGGSIYNVANLYLTNVSFANATAANGAGVYNAENATLDLSNVSFVNMTSTEEGGAIYNLGELIVNVATFDGARATDGAAIYSAGSAHIADAVFANGVATGKGGAIFNDGAELTVSNSEFKSNSATYGGALVNYQGAATVSSATFASNTATDAGAIDNYGVLTLANATFVDNAAKGFGGAIYNSLSSSSDAYVVSFASDVSFSGNSAEKGGAIYNSVGSKLDGDGAAYFDANVATDGGAIYNAGLVAPNAAWSFIGNTASGLGGAIANVGGNVELTKANFQANAAANGGAVYNSGSFYATTSNFESNKASANGGAIQGIAGATTSVSNSVIWKNSAGLNGGAIASVGALQLRNATIAANSAKSGGGLNLAGTAQVYNTIVAGNYATSGVDVYETTAGAFYNSLIGSTVGVNRAPNLTDSLTNVDPSFVVAPTFSATGELTNASSVDLQILATSVAVNAGKDDYALNATRSAALEFDFAGAERICTSLDRVDIGAYEFPFEEPSAVVTTDLDVYDLTDGLVSLREAIDYAVRLQLGVVTFADGITTATLSSSLEINDSIAIDGGNGVVVRSDGFNGSMIVVGNEDSSVNVEIDALTISGGSYVNPAIADDPNYIGGGLRNYANLTLDGVKVVGNTATYGGGVYNAGSLTVYNSTFENNTAKYYGGLYSRGELLVESSRIVGNVAEVYGGGVGLYRGATIVNSAIVGNVAQSGAGVYAQVNASDLINAPNANWDVVLRNDTIAGNFATKNGGGVWTNYRLQLGNTIVNGNAATNGADVYATALLAGGAATAPTAVASNVGRANIAISGARSVDPKFVDFATPTSVEEATAWKEWDLSLQPTSPLVNAGNAAQAVGLNGEALVVDLNGRVRVVGSAVDLGAFEEQGYVPPTDLVVTLAEGVSSDAEQGAVVATVEAIGGSADEYAFALDDPSGLFAIDGNTVVVAGELAAGDYEVTVSVGDLAETFVIVVTDPEAEQYATPVITTIGVASDGQVVVAWSVDDPAKEYVVQYRVKGAQEWKQTSALTGDFGKLVDAEFQPGDVVEARIKALASSVKNESDWSDVVEYEVAAPDPAYSVDFNERAVGESYRLVLVDVVSSSAPYAYWKIDWQDGAVDSFTGLSLSRSFSHLYSQSGVYAPVLYVDNMEGVALNAVVVEVADISGAKLEVDPAKRVAVAAENVFSAVDNFAIASAIAARPSVAVDSASTVSILVEDNAAALDDARDDAFAALDFDADATDELELELEESVFDDAFLGELFVE